MYHYPHCPTGLDSWCKYNPDIADNTQISKPGQCLPKDIIYKIRPIFLELSKGTESKKYLFGKNQNANEKFKENFWLFLEIEFFVTLAKNRSTYSLEIFRSSLQLLTL